VPAATTATRRQLWHLQDVRRRSIVLAGSATAAAAVFGNAFIGRDAMRWFRKLHTPSWQLPMPGFIATGGVYYVLIGYSLDRGNHRSTGWALGVLIGNEAWNAAFFGRRSTRDGFLGLLGFLVPLAGLQYSVMEDAPSRRALMPYKAYVLLYDLP
jgi:tryptophan-rich sensory protein